MSQAFYFSKFWTNVGAFVYRNAGKVYLRVTASTLVFYKEMYGHFSGPKKTGRNNEVAVRRGSTVEYQNSLKNIASLLHFSTAKDVISNL